MCLRCRCSTTVYMLALVAKFEVFWSIRESPELELSSGMVLSPGGSRSVDVLLLTIATEDDNELLFSSPFSSYYVLTSASLNEGARVT